MAVSPLPLLALAVGGELSRVEGAVLVGWWVICLVGLARSGRAMLADESAERVHRPGVRLLVGLGVLTGGGWLLGEGLRSTVRHLGIPQTLLGNTAVAASVEAEEVARVAVPSRRGRPELALGTIGGTIVHFAALNAGVIALVKPLELAHDTTYFYLPVAAASPAILAAGLLVRKRLGRVEGVALMALYVAYVAAAISVSS
jgi:cation:H+ antiporter